jgi:hypothetical protein
MTTTESQTPDLVVFSVWALDIGNSLSRMWRIAVRDASTGQEWDVAWDAVKGSSAERFGEAIREAISNYDAALDRGESIFDLSLPRIFSVYSEALDDFYAGVVGHTNVLIRSARLDWTEREHVDRGPDSNE